MATQRLAQGQARETYRQYLCASGVNRSFEDSLIICLYVDGFRLKAPEEGSTSSNAVRCI